MVTASALGTEDPGSNPAKFKSKKQSNAVVYIDLKCIVCVVYNKKYLKSMGSRNNYINKQKFFTALAMVGFEPLNGYTSKLSAAQIQI
jgi:hypothetical protein